MIRTVEQIFWKQTYSVEELKQIQERKRNEIFQILQNSIEGSKRSSVRVRHLSDDVNNIQIAIDQLTQTQEAR